jgi:hypothetical protein
MIDSTGQVTKDIDAMAQTWEVARRCRNSANIASNIKVEAGKKGYLKCSKLFINSDSKTKNKGNMLIGEVTTNNKSSTSVDLDQVTISNNTKFLMFDG